MKKIIHLIIAVFIGINACHNFDIEHDDYKYSTGYFGYQFPVRILVLGDYIYDNSNDNAHKFIISAHLGGIIDNKIDRKFSIQVDNTLCDNVVFYSNGNPIQAMPSEWYTLSSTSELIIPKGKQSGGVEVQLTDAFFADPNAINNRYAIPIRLTGSNDVDSILQGAKGGDYPNADPRFTGEWDIPPKNFTIFVVKYINEYEASYLHYGSCSVEGVTTTYKDKWVERNEVVKMKTTARNRIEGDFILKSSAMRGTVHMVMTFNGAYNGANSCTISGSGTTDTGMDYTITGNGTFKTFDTEYDNFGQKVRQGITLDYTVTDTNSGAVYTANDVLVVRSRDAIMETYDLRRP